MNLVKGKDFEGYKLKDIQKSVKKSKWEELQDWLNYSPLAEYHGEAVMYKQDWEAFSNATN